MPPQEETGIPTLSWFPVRFLTEMVQGEKSIEAWLTQARDFGFSHVEIHHALIVDEQRMHQVHAKLCELGLGVSMLTCAPDFTNPDPQIRKKQVEKLKTKVSIAQFLGAPSIRVTAGMHYPDVSPADGINWACECLVEVGEYADPEGIKLCLENHYKDRLWDKLDFAVEVDIFLALYDRLKNSPVMVNFDTSQPMVIDIDEVALVEHVKEKVYNVHAGDRLRGQRPHVVIGEGMVDFDGLFSVLSSIGYSRFISVEDGSSEGDEGTRKGVAFLKRKIREHWGPVPS
jgi:sugar phosphate isomerase/epimerase